MKQELKIYVSKIRENPELITTYVMGEDNEYINNMGYKNFVDCCDDEELAYIVDKYLSKQGIVNIQ